MSLLSMESNILRNIVIIELHPLIWTKKDRKTKTKILNSQETLEVSMEKLMGQLNLKEKELKDLKNNPKLKALEVCLLAQLLMDLPLKTGELVLV